jgi:uncharacterized protein involved in exopolysaccharide biosynthesis
MNPVPPELQRADGEGESADLFDYKLLRDYAGFVWRGVKRHRMVALGVFAAIAILGVLGATFLPKTYHVETRILAQRNQVIRSLGNPRSSVGSFDPTQAAQETVLARDNLVSLIKQTNLLDQYASTRPALLQLKDSLSAAVNGPMSEEDRLDSMVGYLEKQIKVTTDEHTLTIGIDWPHPQMAYQLVEAAQQNFLEARHVSEVSAISEAISILEVHASAVSETIEQALDEVERVRDIRRRGGKASLNKPSNPGGEGAATPTATAPKPAAAPVARESVTNAPELAQLKFLIRAKRRSIQDLEDFRARRLTELNQQLAEQKLQYTPQHPVILDAQQRIAALQQESPQVTALKADEQDLLNEYRRKGGKDPDSLVEPSVRGNNLSVRATNELQTFDLGEDPMVEHARTQVRMATAKYEDLTMRIDAARIELDTARAAFKYRYSVVRPASVPRKPLKPNVPVLIGGAIFGAAIIGLFMGAVLDLYSGRIVERWQVERSLKLPVLAEVKRT